MRNSLGYQSFFPLKLLMNSSRNTESICKGRKNVLSYLDKTKSLYAALSNTLTLLYLKKIRYTNY